MEAFAGRKIDELGRVVLPVEFRKQYGWSEKDTVNMYRVGNSILMELAEHPQDPICVFCGKSESCAQFNAYDICAGCLDGVVGHSGKVVQ